MYTIDKILGLITNIQDQRDRGGLMILFHNSKLFFFNVKEVRGIIPIKTAMWVSGRVREERFEIRKFKWLKMFL